MAFDEGDCVFVIAGKYRNRKGIIKRWDYGNAYTVEVIKADTEIVLFDDGKEMLKGGD